MGYEVKNKDLLYKPSSNKKKSKKKRKLPFDPMYLHIALVIIVVLALIFYFTKFSFLDSSEPVKKVDIVGKMESFSKTYSGDLQVKMSGFELRTAKGDFSSKSKQEFVIEGFDGAYVAKNLSFELIGVADKIKFEDNIIYVDGEDFSLKSNKKTTIFMKYENIDLDFKSGRIMFGDVLDFDFKDTRVSLKEYNFSVTYDGTFVFSGIADSFEMDSEYDNLKIIYNESD